MSCLDFSKVLATILALATAWPSASADVRIHAQGIQDSLLHKSISEFTGNSVRFFLADVSKQLRTRRTSQLDAKKAVYSDNSRDDADIDVITQIAAKHTGSDVLRSKASFPKSRPIFSFKQKTSLVPRSASGLAALVQIGEELFDASRVTVVTDLDRNGVNDYIVASPNENESRGAIRLYLMDSDGSVIKSRCIIPGKWGFNTKQLNAGDRFGAAVHVIHDVNRDGVRDVAVGAPGDSSAGESKGAVYILMMSRDGSVVAHSKLSASSDPSLREQHKTSKEFGSFIWPVKDINSDLNDELVIGSGAQADSFTLVLLNEKGLAIGGIKFGVTSDDSKLRNTTTRRGSKNAAKPLRSVMSASPRTGQCISNGSKCPCERITPNYEKLCLEAVHSSGRGRAMCKPRPCETLYNCSCQGTEMCSIVIKPQVTYVFDGEADRGWKYCHEKRVRSTSVQLLPGPEH
jgi:hypothetical protein